MDLIKNAFHKIFKNTIVKFALLQFHFLCNINYQSSVLWSENIQVVTIFLSTQVLQNLKKAQHTMEVLFF